jgi:hypothetical protein
VGPPPPAAASASAAPAGTLDDLIQNIDLNFEKLFKNLKITLKILCQKALPGLLFVLKTCVSFFSNFGRFQCSSISDDAKISWVQ